MLCAHSLGVAPRLSARRGLCCGKPVPAVRVAGPRRVRTAAAPSRPPAGGETWWLKDNPPNMKELSGGVQGFVDALADAGDKLVIVEVYAPWCNACRAVFPKICQMVGEKQDTVVFLKVDLEKNKDMCKTLGIKVLPSFLFYRASEGKVDHFSCTVSKVQRFKDALELHSGAFCSLKPFTGVPEYPDVVPHPELHPAADTPTKLDKKLTPWW